MAGIEVRHTQTHCLSDYCISSCIKEHLVTFILAPSLMCDDVTLDLILCEVCTVWTVKRREEKRREEKGREVRDQILSNQRAIFITLTYLSLLLSDP